MPDQKKLILGVTGSIAAVKSLSVGRALRDHGFSIRVAMTHSARQVVTPQALRAIAESPPYVDMWWPDDEDGGERHVEMAGWADALLIAPATATCLASLAHGFYDNCVTLVAGNLSPDRWLLAPAMSDAMWRQPPVQVNVRQLVDWGATVIGPDEGRVISGDKGQRMTDPDEIAERVASWWQKQRSS
jgi:phosphopantothenoylcysteine decarboxylase/phosphopantothenate--cysteine ligase